MGRKVSSLLERLQQAERVSSAPAQDAGTAIMAAQAMFADIVTRNLKGEIKAEVAAALSQGFPEFVAQVRTIIMDEVRQEMRAMIAAIPVPEKVIERIVERVEKREDDNEDEAPEPITVQRKDGLITSVKHGGKSYDIVRNKMGLIKEVRPRGM